MYSPMVVYLLTQVADLYLRVIEVLDSSLRVAISTVHTYSTVDNCARYMWKERMTYTTSRYLVREPRAGKRNLNTRSEWQWLLVDVDVDIASMFAVGRYVSVNSDGCTSTTNGVKRDIHSNCRKLLQPCVGCGNQQLSIVYISVHTKIVA